MCIKWLKYGSLIACLMGSVHAFANSTVSIALERENELAAMSQDHTLALNQRIAATTMLGNFTGANAIIAVGRASRSQQAELRVASINAARNWQGRAKWDVVSPLLDDVDARVQVHALRNLAPLWTQLPENYRTILDSAIDQRLSNIDNKTEGRLEKAWLYRMRQQYQESEQVLLLEWQSLEQPRTAVALAELYKETNRDTKALEVLNQAVVTHATNALLHHSLALTYWRTQQASQSITHMRQALEIEPENAQYAYLLGLMLVENEPKKALPLFESAYVQQGNPQYLYSLCEAQLAATEQAKNCLTLLGKYYPETVITALSNKYPTTRNFNENNK